MTADQAAPRVACFVDELPPGDWQLQRFAIDGWEVVVAICPTHEPRFYRNGKRILVDFPLAAISSH